MVAGTAFAARKVRVGSGNPVRRDRLPRWLAAGPVDPRIRHHHLLTGRGRAKEERVPPRPFPSRPGSPLVRDERVPPLLSRSSGPGQPSRPSTHRAMSSVQRSRMSPSTRRSINYRGRPPESVPSSPRGSRERREEGRESPMARRPVAKPTVCGCIPPARACGAVRRGSRDSTVSFTASLSGPSQRKRWEPRTLYGSARYWHKIHRTNRDVIGSDSRSCGPDSN